MIQIKGCRFLLSSCSAHEEEERYARGEISREEYLQKKRDIEA
jgi:uncharacterized membrane protein